MTRCLRRLPSAAPGIRTHSTLALVIGAAERTGSRRAVLRSLANGLAARGGLRGSREVLTPVWSDPVSALPLLLVTARMLARPREASALAAGAVADYSVPPPGADAVREPPRHT